MPAKLDSCVEKLKKEGHDEDSAWAICTDSVKKSRKTLDIAWNDMLDTHIAQQETPHGEPKGTILAFGIPRYIGRELYMVGGNAIEEMHITLAYVENPDEITLDILRTVAADFAKHAYCISAEVGGLGRFFHEDDDVIYASIDSPQMGEYRERLVNRLLEAGVDVSFEHGFTPHCTVKYVSKDEETPLLRPEANQSWTICTLELWHNNYKYIYRFSG